MPTYEQQEALLSIQEAVSIHNCAEASSRTEGDVCEVGVYKGGSIEIIASVLKEKIIYGFDTFEGLPGADSTHYQGQCYADFKYVEKKLSRFKNVRLIKGLFKYTQKSIENKKFAFVHIDVDIKKYIKECLEFLYPRLSLGGLLLCHDYCEHDGVKKMIDEYFRDKNATLIPLTGSQCLVVKR